MATRYGSRPIMGIDYGSKLAGTTCIAALTFPNKSFSLVQSEKKKDADAFILAFAKTLPPGLLLIDAPLSIPGVYTGMSGKENFFYRSCDQMLSAMSPMFLGGLTARAMKLKRALQQSGWQVEETYPAEVVKSLGHSEYYHKKNSESLPGFQNKLLELLPQLESQALENYHQADACLALCAAIRFEKNEATVVGDEEGEIII